MPRKPSNFAVWREVTEIVALFGDAIPTGNRNHQASGTGANPAEIAVSLGRGRASVYRVLGVD